MHHFVQITQVCSIYFPYFRLILICLEDMQELMNDRTEDQAQELVNDRTNDQALKIHRILKNVPSLSK